MSSLKKTKILQFENGIEAFLSNFKDHHRLSVFDLKGLSCVVCGLTGNKIIMWYDRAEVDVSRGGLHVDLYSNDIVITVDHIVPKALGGSDRIENKQPMCGPCNSKKGTRMSEQDKLIALQNMLSMAHLKPSIGYNRLNTRV